VPSDGTDASGAVRATISANEESGIIPAIGSAIIIFNIARR
jgi:hypothetical protein